MTRETKVGIVVSCSFVSLVGVVIASKVRGEPLPTEPPASTAALESRGRDSRGKERPNTKTETKPAQQDKGPPPAAEKTATDGKEKKKSEEREDKQQEEKTRTADPPADPGGMNPPGAGSVSPASATSTPAPPAP